MQAGTAVRLAGNRTDARTQFLPLPETVFHASCSKFNRSENLSIPVVRASGLRSCRLVLRASLELTLIVNDQSDTQVIAFFDHVGW